MSPAGVPGYVVAAPASGSGKTTVATGLMAAHAGCGRVVAPFKVGPDYIDPGYHGLAAGRPGRNLDPVLVGPQRIAPLYAHGAAGADLAVVEGVMGLFDGRVDDHAPAAVTVAEGSTAHVAGLLGLPVVLVVDARGHSQSMAALVRGFATHDPATRVAGVVLNRVGGDRHAAILTAACESVGVPVLGALPRRASVAVPSRHLGLVTATEYDDEAAEAVREMRRVVSDSVDLDALEALAAPAAAGAAWDPVAEVAAARAADGATGPRPDEEPVTVAVAGGAAFTFAYPEHTELLAAAGARVVTLDPVHDTALPPGTEALVLPGGFPELHLDALSANTALRADVARAVAEGMPVHAECAGLLYLCRDLTPVSTDPVDTHPAPLPMCGVLPGRGRFTGRLTLGYREAVALADSVTHRAGERVTGHEFHRTVVDTAPATDTAPSTDTAPATDTAPSTDTAPATDADPAPAPAWAWRDWRGAPVREGAVSGGVHASYLHTHPAGHPAGPTRQVDAARARRAAAGAR